MGHPKFAASFAALALLCATGASFGALAKSTGGTASTSGTLSSNPSIRQQQLIVDPFIVTKGKLSIQYDPSVVTMYDPAGVIPSPQVTGLNGYRVTGIAVDFVNNSNPPPDEIESGVVTISFTQQTFGGYADNHIDVFAAKFYYKEDVPLTTVAHYTVFAKPDDFLEGKEDGTNTIIRFEGPARYVNGELTGINSITASASLVPEPASLSLLGGLAIAGLRRNRRV